MLTSKSTLLSNPDTSMRVISALQAAVAAEGGNDEAIESVFLYSNGNGPLKAIARFIAKTVKQPPHQILRVTSLSAQVSAADQYRSDQCLKVDEFVIRSRDRSLAVLPVDMPAVSGGSVCAYGITDPGSFRFCEIVGFFLGISKDDSLVMQERMVKNEHTFALPQVEALIRRTEAAEPTGLLTNGQTNIFFIHDMQGSVYEVLARRFANGWSLGTFPFAAGQSRLWPDDYMRAFFRNEPRIS